MTIKNPVEWSGEQLVHAARALGSFGHSLQHISETIDTPVPVVQKITIADLRDALHRGYADFLALRSDVVLIGVIYAIVGLVLDQALVHASLLPLLFPLASGFAIVGPIAALGLYEMSRQREHGGDVTWATGLDALRSPSLGAITVLGLILGAVFALWLVTAWLIYRMTMGPVLPSAVAPFIRDVLFTNEGHLMIGIGVAAGFFFAAAAMAIGVISFPLLLDRDVGLRAAMRTSLRAVAINPWQMALWGLIVAFGLVLGSLPAFVGLAVVFPVLGHATWHLYRKVVAA